MRNTDSLPKVLIVNDDASTLLALASLLEDPSENPKYEVFTVQSGEEALRKVLKHNFAVILLDVSMPIMDGFETAEAIHSHPRSATVPIIFVTAYYGDEFNRLKGYQKGAADYLFAPVIPKVVQAKVAVFVELNQKTLELEHKTRQLEAINDDLRVKRLQDLESVNAALTTEIQERRLAEERAIELATRDTLTGLFNRRSLLERLKHSITQASRRHEGLALMFLDLDKFKEINDVYGHEVGDDLLKQFAVHLNAAVRESDMVARLGGDEFVILLEGFPDASDVVKVAKKILQYNAEPQVIGAQTLKTPATIGISFYPQDGISAEELLKNADMAMYHAKQRERGTIQFFHEELNAAERVRNQLEQELQQALDNNEFELLYQPKIDITSGQATGVEALLYWHHPAKGLLAPSEFLAQIAQSVQAIRVDEWIIAAACAQAQAWREHSASFTLPISINIDITRLQTGFFKALSGVLNEHGLSAACLQLEVSESMVVNDLANTAAVFRELKDSGISVAIDNFGAGFSSLALLKTLSITSFKIDPSFISPAAIGNSAQASGDGSALAIFPQDTSLVSALLAMARACGARVLAEGVDNQEEFDALKALGCDEYQGSFFCDPLSADALLERLSQHSAAKA
jgi:diguanylate cyclase (GGDEF)-like protein